MMDSIVVRITGDSGDGIQLVGEQLTLTAALTGREVCTLPDFPAEIRAPAGTRAGISGFQLAIADKALFTAGESLDVLVALNPAALKHSLQYLNQDGLLIINEDSFQEKDWQKAGLSPSYLEEQVNNYQLLSLPLITQTIAAVEHLQLSNSQARKTKNFYVLGLVLWLFDLPIETCITLIEKKFKANSQLIAANTASLKAGYNYAMTLELSRREYFVGAAPKKSGEYCHLTGIQAITKAIATVALCTKTPLLVSGYPITPASQILHSCTKLAPYGVQLLQSEDEIAALCACIGAAFAGHLALTCTSGPGFDLKSESLGLAVITELPVVILDVQRAGASTGLPTKTGQSDLRQALYGRHGEAPMPVLAASSPSDCFYSIIEAFKIAVKYMTPVIVLLDAYVCNAAEPWKIPAIETLSLPEIRHNRFPKPFARDNNFARSWNIPGTQGLIHQLGGLEKEGEDGQISYDANNHEKMVALRAEKIQAIADEYAPLHIEGDLSASLVLIGWGSTYGSLRAALEACGDLGLPVALLHLRHLNPLPADLGGLLHTFEKVLVAELNTGHLCQLLRAEYLINAKPINQCNGQPFSVQFLVKAIEAEVTHEYYV